MNRPFLTLAIVALFACSTHATVLTYKGGNGTSGYGFEQTSVDLFDDDNGAETDAHDDQAYGDNVTGLGPDANNFEYGEQGEGFTPNITVEHRGRARRHSNFGGCYGGSGTHNMCTTTGPNPSPDGVEIPFLHGGTSDLSGDEPVWVEFTAEPGFDVTMFDLYVMGDLNTTTSAGVIVKLLDGAGGGELFNSGVVEILRNEPNLVDLQGTTAPFIRLELDWHPGISGGAFGFGDFTTDNIRFGQNGTATAPPSRFTWNTNGLGDWADSANWTPKVVGDPNSANHTAIFEDRGGITGPTLVSTMADVTLNRIEFTNTANNFVIAGLGSVNMSATTGQTPVDPSMSVQGTHEFQVAVNLVNDTTVDVASDATLTLNNTLNLMSHTLEKTGAGTMSVRNDFVTGGGTLNIAQGTVSGNGTVGGSTNNVGGTIAPGNSPGVLTINGDLSNGAGGTIAMEIEGTDGPGEANGHDQVQVTGSSDLDGTLNIIPGSYSDPTTRAARDTFTLISAAGGSTGAFGTVNYDGSVLSADFSGPNGSFRDHIDNGLFRNVDYDGSNVRLTNLFALEGDADGDIDIDITDFNILASNFDDTGANSATNDWTTADFDADGDIDITDFNFLAANFADTGYAGQMAGQVPEPTTWILLTLGLACGCLSLRGRK